MGRRDRARGREQFALLPIQRPACGTPSAVRLAPRLRAPRVGRGEPVALRPAVMPTGRRGDGPVEAVQVGGHELRPGGPDVASLEMVGEGVGDGLVAPADGEPGVSGEDSEAGRLCQRLSCAPAHDGSAAVAIVRGP